MILNRDTIITVDDNIKDKAVVILQLQTLFSTPVGSVALDRDFGLDMSVLDLPVPVAQARLSAEVIEKVAQYIPTIIAYEVTFLEIDNTEGSFRMEVKVKDV